MLSMQTTLDRKPAKVGYLIALLHESSCCSRRQPIMAIRESEHKDTQEGKFDGNWQKARLGRRAHPSRSEIDQKTKGGCGL
jgi:hypothetical protein